MKPTNAVIKWFKLSFILCATCFCNSAYASGFENIARAAGFVYDPKQDIYITRLDSFQRYFGFNGFYDRIALPAGMIIHAEPIKFEYNGKRYMLELWKGQYGVMTGAEIGLYEKKYGYNYKCVADEDMIYMSYSLYKKGVKLFTRRGVHWWLTGFKPGEFAAPDELTMENVYIRFNSQGMRDAFLKALYATGYTDISDSIFIDAKNGIGFRFTTPKTPQPWAKPARDRGLEAIASMVKRLNRGKVEVARTDNSPETMDLLLARFHLKFLSDLFK